MKSFGIKTALVAASAFALASAGPITGSDLELVDKRMVPDNLEVPTLQRRNGELYCGNFASGNGQMANELTAEIYYENSQHTIGTHACSRIKCRDTTGIYVCNDNSGSLTVSGRDIENHAHNILQRCCIHDASGGWLYGSSTAGQQFTDANGGNWNVVVGYADCNHAASEKPGNIGGWGVNTSCKRMNEYIG